MDDVVLVARLLRLRLERGARKMVSTVAKTLDPTRELREAREAFDYTPTAQNQMRLAAALLESDQAQEAATNFEACLKGPFSNDPEMRFGAARAFFACGRYAEAISHLESIRKTDATYRAEEVSVLLAKTLGSAGRRREAQAEFEQALERFGSFECRAEYAIWAISAGERDLAARLQIDIQRSMERWNRHTRDLNMPLTRRLNAAYEMTKQTASRA